MQFLPFAQSTLNFLCKLPYGADLQKVHKRRGGERTKKVDKIEGMYYNELTTD